MAEIIRMPAVLAGAAEAAIQSWLVQPGDPVALQQPIAEIETEKAIVEIQADVEGMVGRLLAAEGDTIAVGEPLIVLNSVGESDDAIDAALAGAGIASTLAMPESTVTHAPAAPEPETAPESKTAPAVPTPQHAFPPPSAAAYPRREVDERRIFASPLVRRLAAEKGVDLRHVAGSGPNGRIVRRDLERHLAPPPATVDAHSAPASAPAPTAPPVAPPASTSAAASYEDVPLDRMRRAIARRLIESKSTVPHFYLVADCRVDDLLILRAEVNASATRKISVNDFVLKAVAAALVEVPVANAIWNEDSIRRFSTVDISVAVATEGGLTTPVLRSVERMSLTSVSETVGELAGRARAGRLKQQELEGGSFSVSNLGMYGTSQFSAILNPPQSGILAVGAARRVPVVGEDGQLTVGQVMTVTLSADHRVLDGAVAAEWLAAFQRRIENPLTILI